MEKLEDIILKKGDIVKLKDGGSFTINGLAETSLKDYNYSHGEKVVEVKRPVKYETIYKAPQEILDKEEKEYLSAVIKPFKNKVVYIKKHTANRYEWIGISLDNGCFAFPDFDKGTMYKGMEPDKEYTLEELGL